MEQLKAQSAVGSTRLLADWPKTERGRNLCSPEHPMPKGALGFWEHTNTEEVGDQRDRYPGGDIVTMRCKDCGETWEMELPQ